MNENPQDLQHLYLLKIFHYINAGLCFLFMLIPTIHITLGLTMVFDPQSMADSQGPPPPFFGWMFVGIGVTVMLLLAALGVSQIIVGRSLTSFRRYTFILIIAGLNCLNMPLGTVLGVFTIVVLMRPSVKALFYGPGPLGSPYR